VIKINAKLNIFLAYCLHHGIESSNIGNDPFLDHLPDHSLGGFNVTGVEQAFDEKVAAAEGRVEALVAHFPEEELGLAEFAGGAPGVDEDSVGGLVGVDAFAEHAAEEGIGAVE